MIYAALHYYLARKRRQLSEAEVRAKATLAQEIEAVFLLEGKDIPPQVQTIIQRSRANGNGSNGNGQH